MKFKVACTVGDEESHNTAATPHKNSILPPKSLMTLQTDKRGKQNA